eukprot:PhF_6_TR5163/c0_g1_i2/m.7394
MGCTHTSRVNYLEKETARGNTCLISEPPSLAPYIDISPGSGDGGSKYHNAQDKDLMFPSSTSSSPHMEGIPLGSLSNSSFPSSFTIPSPSQIVLDLSGNSPPEHVGPPQPFFIVRQTPPLLLHIQTENNEEYLPHHVNDKVFYIQIQTSNLHSSVHTQQAKASFLSEDVTGGGDPLRPPP